ncbi:MAG TPA: hypothetical protein VL593_16880 [Ramlibacter sp.]|jgi:hypothetical protein|nr:hypothetical protein [Ramlibacter sp.]
MARVLKWLLALVAIFVVLIGAIAFALHLWVGSADFRARVAQEISAAVGVPVELGGLDVDVWPLPGVAVDRVQVKSRPPLTFERIEARPVWSALLHRKLEIATLYVRNAVVPQDAIAAVAAAFRKAHPEDGAMKKEKAPQEPSSVTLPQRIVLEQVTWVDTKGAGNVVDATVHMDDDGLPGHVDFAVTQGRWQGVKAKLQRAAKLWQFDGQVGGGTIKGHFVPGKTTRGDPLVTGELDTSNVEVSYFTAPSKTMTGRLEAHTQLQADLRDLAAVADVLHTQTKFTVHNAVVHGIDLAQAVKTVGINRGGETHLDTLAGQLTTHGRTAELRNLVASSGALSATGNVNVAANKNLSGSVNVNLAEKVAGTALGVPLIVGGTLDSPSVTLSRSALLGAAIGTVIAPGVGTAGGAKVGDKLGDTLKGLFGK